MREWTGVVEQISDKDWNNIKLWSFKIEGEDRWFRTQKTPLDVPLGTTITFTERNNQVVMESVQSTESAAPSSDVVETSASTASPSTATAPDANGVGKRMAWEAARRDACNVVVAALHTDSLPWNKSLAKGKRLDMLRSYIKELTVQFLEEENDY